MQGKWMMGCSTEFMEPVHTDTDDKRGDKRYQEVKKKKKENPASDAYATGAGMKMTARRSEQ